MSKMNFQESGYSVEWFQINKENSFGFNNSQVIFGKNTTGPQLLINAVCTDITDSQIAPFFLAI